MAKILSRLTWDYYVLGTVGLNIIVYMTLINWQSLTNGPLGIAGIPRPRLGPISFVSNESFLVLAIFFAGLIYLISQYIVTSSFGRVLKAIREDNSAAQVFGYQTTHYKLAVFVIAACMASVAGSLYAPFMRFIDPTGAALMDSVYVFSIVILGGSANLRGSILGALVLVLLPELLRFVGFTEDTAAQLRQLFYGLLLVVLMRWRPQGLLGEYKL